MGTDDAELWAAYDATGRAQGSAEEGALMRFNQRLVFYLANRVRKYAVLDLDDLISIGNIGLLRAIRTYDKSRCPSFGPWAGRCITQAWHRERYNLRITAEEESGKEVSLLSELKLNLDSMERLSASFDLGENADAVAVAMSALDDYSREVIAGMYFHGKTAVQVSKDTGRSLGMVWGCHKRALGKMKKIIERHGEHALSSS